MSWKEFVQWIGEQDFFFWATVVSLIVTVLSLIYAEIERRGRNRDQQEAVERQRQVEEQLRIAREQAALVPLLAVSFKAVVFHNRPPNAGSPLVQAAVVFNVTNEGRSVAHNVRCVVRFKEEDLVPDDMHGANYDFTAQRIGPKDRHPYQINVGIRSYGLTKAHYWCVCDEVGDTEGEIPFEVPEPPEPDEE